MFVCCVDEKECSELCMTGHVYNNMSCVDSATQ